MIAILESYRAGLLVRANFWRNVMAGCIVGVVALPLAMAFAIASGARPDTTGLSALDEIVADFQRTGTRVVLCEVRANVIEKLERAGISARVGERGVYGTLSEFAASVSN